MKNWPKNGDTAAVESLLRPLAKMLRQVYKQKDIDKVFKGKGMGWDYKGFRVFRDAIQPKERFTVDYLALDLEDQGFDLIDNVLVTAFQYGIEQGKRIDKSTVETVMITIKCALSAAKNKGDIESTIKVLKGGLTCANNLLPDDIRKKSTVTRKQ